VFRSPPGGLDIFRVATVKSHAVGRTVGGLVGVVPVVSRYGRHIDQFFGKGARPGLGGLGEAGRALEVAAVFTVRHDCGHKEPPRKEINAPGRKRRPMGAPRRGRAQNIPEMWGNLKKKAKQG
jgi:hypothetical protein